jgi:hypothetical protein
MVLQSAWRVIPRAYLRGILDTVRTRILDFALAIEGEAPGAGEVAAGSEPPVAQRELTQIFHTTIHQGHAIVGTSGGQATVSIDSVTFSSAIPEEPRDEITNQLRALASAVERTSGADREDGAEALAKIKHELAAPQPDTSRIERCLTLLANVTTIAASAGPAIQALRSLLSAVLPV